MGKQKDMFYEINFKCPRKLRVATLPRKKPTGGFEWSLYDGARVYTSVDIENAIDNGHEVEFINSCLVWDQSGDVFSKYIDKYYKLKEDATEEKNEVKRSIAKLMLNALYGKTLQSARYTDHKLINNKVQFNDFLRDQKLVEF
eukprot:m.259421 g.259421  ORF g.259421 m.259421 type:complete len:143 (+) comp26772_c1_seq21:1836-2264(+)